MEEIMLFEENDFINSYLTITPEGHYLSNCRFTEQDTFIEWVYLSAKDLKKTHYREKACAIAYRYYKPTYDIHTLWGCQEFYPSELRFAKTDKYINMLADVQRWEDEHGRCLHSWIA